MESPTKPINIQLLSAHLWYNGRWHCIITFLFKKMQEMQRSIVGVTVYRPLSTWLAVVIDYYALHDTAVIHCSTSRTLNFARIFTK
jgi:hypothetical protein